MKLYIVATPIGNLEDISLRALRILKEVDFVLCEDTRVTRVLLAKYEIKTPTISYFQHSGLTKVNQIIDLLKTRKIDVKAIITHIIDFKDVERAFKMISDIQEPVGKVLIRFS